jgi:hypothetical protein
VSASSGTRPPKIPSLARRIAVASIRLVGLLIVFVAIPLGLLQILASHGINPPYSILTVSAVGILLSVLGASATIARPTRLYGPIALASSVILFLWLLALARDSTIRIGIGSSGGFLQLSYGSAILLVTLVPVLLACAAIGTTAEDLRKPGERLPFDYPP